MEAGRGCFQDGCRRPCPTPTPFSLESHVERGRSTTRNVPAKKKDTVVLGKLFWPEHFQLGSRHFRGPPFAQLASG